MRPSASMPTARSGPSGRAIRTRASSGRASALTLGAGNRPWSLRRDPDHVRLTFRRDPDRATRHDDVAAIATEIEAPDDASRHSVDPRQPARGDPDGSEADGQAADARVSRSTAVMTLPESGSMRTASGSPSALHRRRSRPPCRHSRRSRPTAPPVRPCSSRDRSAPPRPCWGRPPRHHRDQPS